MLSTRARPNTPADRFESEQFLFLLDSALAHFAPNTLLTYGSHPVVREGLRRARARGAITVFSLRNYGYEDRGDYEDVDHVLTASPYLSRVYKQRIGLRSVGIESPIDWSAVQAPADMRRFVTFINPSLAKGAMAFARLADMLGSRRPDIPVLVVQSAHAAGALNAIPGIDFTRYPQIMAAPATLRPADFLALTRILLMPSAFDEPFGRVAVEAMINAIPGDRQHWVHHPETVGDGGVLLPLPAWLTANSRDLPSAEELTPWFDAVCRLWDDAAAYDAIATRAIATANRRFSEPIMRGRYRDYFESLKPGGDLFATF